MPLEPTLVRALPLSNRAVMSPMTRNRAVEASTPNALMAEYDGQRATAGLIVTEGTSPSPNALGYPRIPGLFNAAQVQGWKLVTDAVHAKGGRIVLQLMHTPGASRARPTCPRVPRSSARWPAPARARCTPMRKACRTTARRVR